MDGNRFDTISRAIAARNTRRDALRQVGAGGFLAAIAGAFGIGRLHAAAQEVDISDDDVCTLPFTAEVATGPDQGDVYEGELSFRIGRGGTIDQGVLRTDDGDEYDVVGQTTGRAINLRIELDDDRVLSLTGSAQERVSRCRGEISGTFGGPQWLDLGTWSTTRRKESVTPTATAAVQTGGGTSNGGTNSGGTGGSPSQPTATPTTCPPTDCGVTFVLDPMTCECVCPSPYTRCGDSCCFGGAVCNSDGSCNCPAGMEPCNEVCTPSCPSGQYFDANCQCTAQTSCGAGETLCNGQCVSLSCPPDQLFDPGSCGCVNRCGSGQGYCGGNCIDIVNDANNCGSCGNVCPPNMPCIAGTCKCPATQNYVNGQCQ